ncbi:MAG: hypothetical protein A2Y62_16855 [Candidatus Fischerbacteria bacterium RBG_13_37_8]|uniref:Glycosyltransferase subfamily 4-like N-terminal domain-containing protein n=1 Tax=Candidatus Fischerbacteria bacterium RBG_13_37_8 TaxID=1817863 RepID=A0A1F5V9L0_9BACT|nr:MAG: hypothetical protein A2Y62_16855 [Candidatus Fischerbacteria bacterium RBG_13_37_8]
MVHLAAKNNITVISKNYRSKLYALLPGVFHLHSFVKSFQPDIIHSHLYSGELLVCLYKMLFRNPITCVSSVQSLRRQLRKRNILTKNIVDALVRKYYRKIIACSEAVKHELITNGYGQHMIEVIYNGIDFSKFIPPKREPVLPEKPVIGFIGRLATYKGTDIFIKAIPPVIKEYPSSIFWIIGDGTEKEHLIRMVQDLGIINHVQFWGFQTNTAQFLSQFSLLAVPSLTEPLGIVALEGLAMSLPVIASNIEGLKEIIQHDETGYLVEPGSSNELAKRIIEVLHNYPSACKVAAKGNAYCKMHFNIQSLSEKQLKLYQSL